MAPLDAAEAYFGKPGEIIVCGLSGARTYPRMENSNQERQESPSAVFLQHLSHLTARWINLNYSSKWEIPLPPPHPEFQHTIQMVEATSRPALPDMKRHSNIQIIRPRRLTDSHRLLLHIPPHVNTLPRLRDSMSPLLLPAISEIKPWVNDCAGCTKGISKLSFWFTASNRFRSWRDGDKSAEVADVHGSWSWKLLVESKAVIITLDLVSSLNQYIHLAADR